MVVLIRACTAQYDVALEADNNYIQTIVANE